MLEFGDCNDILLLLIDLSDLFSIIYHYIEENNHFINLYDLIFIEVVEVNPNIVKFYLISFSFYTDFYFTSYYYRQNHN